MIPAENRKAETMKVEMTYHDAIEAVRAAICPSQTLAELARASGVPGDLDNSDGIHIGYEPTGIFCRQAGDVNKDRERGAVAVFPAGWASAPGDHIYVLVFPDGSVVLPRIMLSKN